MSVFDTEISLLRAVTDTKPISTPLRVVLEGFRSGRWRKGVENVREKRAKYEAARGTDGETKAQEVWQASKSGFLPAVLLSVSAKSRAKRATREERDERPTGFLQVDLDHVPEGEKDKAVESMKALPFIAAVWVSPSGDGLKAIACVEGAGEYDSGKRSGRSLIDPRDPDRHHRAFLALDDELRRALGVGNDEKVKDPARLCFVSYDPDLWTRPEEPVPLRLPPMDSMDSVEIEPHFAEEAKKRMESGRGECGSGGRGNRNPVENVPRGLKSRDQAAAAVDERSRKILAKIRSMPISVQGKDGNGDAMRVARALVSGFALSQAEALGFMEEWNRTNANPPWGADELGRMLHTVATTRHTMPLGCLWRADAEVPAAPAPLVAVSVEELITRHRDYKPRIIEGLLRRGEVMNVIASPKVGKSHLVNLMALSIANGVPFLGMDTTRAPVLIIDNELHPETSAQRFRRMCEHAKLSGEGVSIVNLRGNLRDIEAIEGGLCEAANKLKPGLIVLDALYRFLPEGMSENDNAGLARLFNILDRIAMDTGAALVNIHHASKGEQGNKAITDLGAGAGAFARAADTHLGIRPHPHSPDETDKLAGAMWVNAQYTARTWPGGEFVISREKDGFLWVRLYDIEVEVDGAKKKLRRPRDVEVLAMLTEEPQTGAAIARKMGANPGVVKTLLEELEGSVNPMGLTVWATRKGNVNYPCYHLSMEEPVPPQTEKDRCAEYLRMHPDASDAAVATVVGCNSKTAKRARIFLAEMDARLNADPEDSE